MPRKKKIFYIAISCLLLISTATAVLLGFQTPNKESALSLDSSAQDWSMPNDKNSSQENSIKIPGYGTIYFPQNTKTVPITLYNPEENGCFFIFTLTVDDNTDPLYTSGYVEPGKSLMEITMSRALAAGEYTLYIHVDAYDRSSQQPLNSAVVKTDLVVG